MKYLGFKMKAATSVSFPLITVGVNQQALCKGQAGLQVCRLWYYVVKELQYTASTRLHTHTTETKELRVLEFFFFLFSHPKERTFGKEQTPSMNMFRLVRWRLLSKRRE